MKKKTIVILWIIGIIIALIGVAMFVPAIVTAANNCTINTVGRTTCSHSTTINQLTSIAITGVGVLFIGGIISTIAWIGALVRSAKMQSWAWFVIILLFHSLGTLIYLIASPGDQPTTPKDGPSYAVLQ